jgi:hypothetical protein
VRRRRRLWRAGEDPAELPAALDRAVHALTVEKRQALLNVICRGV